MDKNKTYANIICFTVHTPEAVKNILPKFQLQQVLSNLVVAKIKENYQSFWQ